MVDSIKTTPPQLHDAASICQRIQQKAPLLGKNSVEILPANSKEMGFSSKKYLAVAIIIASVAGAIFSLCMPLAIAFFTVASWYLWSALIIAINRKAKGTRLENLANKLHATAMEINASVKAAFLFPLTLFKSYHNPKGNPHGRPILMVNGYLSFGSTWHYQRKKLVKAGFGPIYTMNVGSGSSIKTYAQQVHDKVTQIQKETNRNDLILIGHSKGGLVSSYYATHLADSTKTKITDIITIGSPLAGTPVAHIGLGQDAYEMRTKSKFHENLRNKICQQTQIRFSHIGSKADAVVPISSSLLGKDQSRQLVLKDVGHLGLLFSSRVADQISHWLK